MQDLVNLLHTPIEPDKGNIFYNSYELQEDIERTSYHYEHDPEFFLTTMGSQWHCYSCGIWSEGGTVTQSEETKLDKFAELLELKPGMHILDVGCGWGGPLVYLCEKYGVTAHGITISPSQIPVAQLRATHHQVQVQFDLLHWKNLPNEAKYDAILTDEVMVHFHNLAQFFEKCQAVLKPGRMMAHKELHLARREYGEIGRASQHVNKIYGYTGNYQTLHDELRFVEEAGFLLREIHQIPIYHYHLTLDTWLKNLFDNRDRLKEITSPEFYKDFRAYVKAVRYIFTRTEQMNLHIVASRKI